MSEMNITPGMYAISKAGHDKDHFYLIIKEEGDFLYLVDGKGKGIQNPKKKRKKHVQLVKTGVNEEITEKIIHAKAIYDEEIRFVIKQRVKKEADNV